MSLTEASNPVINSWVFRCTATDDPNGLQTIGIYIFQQFLTKFYTPLASFLATDLRCAGASIRNLDDPTDGFDISVDFGMGSAAGSMCPPFVTYSVQLQRSTYDIRNGRKGLPAVPTINVNDKGVITPTVKAAIQAVIDDEWTGDFHVEAGAAEFTFSDVIARLPVAGGPPAVFSPIINYSLRGLGTQNSRK